MSERGPHCKWTNESLHQHFTAILAERQKALDAALAAMNARLETMNEFRASIEDQSAKMLPRREAWAFLIGLTTVAFGVIGSAAAIVTIWAAFQ